jgi:hypothetical protein
MEAQRQSNSTISMLKHHNMATTKRLQHAAMMIIVGEKPNDDNALIRWWGDSSISIEAWWKKGNLYITPVGPPVMCSLFELDFL